MSARDRLPPWHERHRLPNGREVLVRPVRPEDAEPLRAGLTLLEPSALRLRLAGGQAELGPEAAQRLTRLNPRTDFMLVAGDPEPPGEAVIAALAHVRTDAAGHRGEFTVLVSPFVAGTGIGRYLLTRVVKWARGRRVDLLQGDLPAANATMLELATSLGFHRLDAGDDPAFVRVSLGTAR
jgi:GNAT superfamily N-acetyltransferase